MAPVTLPEQLPGTTDVAAPPEIESTVEANQDQALLPAESRDAAAPADDPIAVEYQTIKVRYDRAFSHYTILITGGGSGSVIEARDEYAAAYEDLKQFQATHPEYAQ